jgi:polysaccharide deacetylase family protein (PEP-CTERM system associated)
MKSTEPVVMSSTAQAHASKTHLLSVMLEDYFHVAAFDHLIQREQWYRFETRSEKNTLRTLDMLDRFDIKATFFVIGWIAERQPELIKEVVRRGHEVASRGLYRHRRERPMTPAEFRDDVRRTRETLEKVCGKSPLGHRAARHWTDPSCLWTLDVLAEEGYLYDCSFLPTANNTGTESHRRFAYPHQTNGRVLWEFPVSTYSIGGFLLPVSGGNYLRQLPHSLLKHAVEHWHRNYEAPFMMYFHVWELDPEMPRISSTSRLTRMRQYRKLDKISWMLEDYFGRYKFTGVADYLKDEVEQVTMTPLHVQQAPAPSSAIAVSSPREDNPATALALPGAPAAATVPASRTDSSHTLTPVSIVVPCYNEELTLPYLANTLRSLEETLAGEYEVRFIFVNDCSTDGTQDALRRVFGEWPNCEFLEHEENQGVAAAVLTGIRSARTEIVCSIDCDCTYDPHELRHMIPLLADDADLVTASPYHPQGRVRNVPSWRLALSRASSRLYRRTLSGDLHTYTSCFRVYRRSAVAALDLTEGGFLGIAELLAKLHLQGSKIVEHPATLEVRLFGYSKMKVAKTIAGHLGLLSRLLALRLGRDLNRRRRENQGAALAPAPAFNNSSPQPLSSAIAHEERK